MRDFVYFVYFVVFNFPCFPAIPCFSVSIPCILRFKPSNNQHAVAVGEESVFLPDCEGVGAEHPFAPGKSAHHHKKRGLRQMEVSQHRVRHLKTIRRIDENVRRAAAGDDQLLSALPLPRGDGFESPDGRRTDANDASAAFFCLVDRLGGFRRNGERLEIHPVVFDIIRLDGAESPRPDVQRHRDARPEVPQGDAGGEEQ